MIEQLIPLGELGVLLGIWKRLGDLRQDTDRNEERIGKIRDRLESIEKRVRRPPRA